MSLAFLPEARDRPFGSRVFRILDFIKLRVEPSSGFPNLANLNYCWKLNPVLDNTCNQCTEAIKNSFSLLRENAVCYLTTSSKTDHSRQLSNSVPFCMKARHLSITVPAIVYILKRLILT